MIIEEFQGKYRFLSNFCPAIVKYNGREYPTSEHAYQAQKAIDSKHQEFIRSLTKPWMAKRKIREMQAQGLTHNKSDWDRRKIDIMKEVVEAKFRQNPNLERKLLLTGTKYLEEGNTWGDKFWGICDDEGENHLGLILMEVRNKLREER